MATLEKAKLIRVDKPSTTTDVLFNPQEYSVQKSVQYEPHKSPGLDLPEQEFTSGNPSLLSVELFFDTYESKKDVSKEFCWGTFLFEGFIESLTLRYTMFLPSGKPCRATANLSIKQYESAKDQLQRNPRNSPDHTKRRTLKMGETLALIAHEEYDDAAEWRRIADANGIVDPREVKPGTVLLLPPIL